MAGKKKYKNINVQIPCEIHARFKAVCASSKINTAMKKIIIQLMTDFVEGIENDKQKK